MKSVADMKNQALALLATALMLLALFGIDHMNVESKNIRYHQHQSPSAILATIPISTLTNSIPMPSTSTVAYTDLASHLPILTIDTRGLIIPGLPTTQRDRFGENTYLLSENGSKTILAQLNLFNPPNNPPNKLSTSTPLITDRTVPDPTNSTTDRTVPNLTNPPALSSEIEIRLRGHASRRYPKGSYAIRLTHENQQNNPQNLMGMASHHEWVLHGPFIDRTMIRNYLWYNLAGEIMDYAPNVRFCELILNGDYQGLYLLTESITEGKDGRLPLSKNAKNAQAIGYLLRVDRPTEADLDSVKDIYTYAERMGLLHQDIRIEYPGTSNLTEQSAKSIELDVSAFEKSLYSFDFNHPLYGYRNRIDVASFVDYFILNEFSGNRDAGLYSTYLYKPPGEAYKLCVWDFNNSCDNFPNSETSTEGFFMMDRVWFFMLMKDEYFVEQILKRYAELRQGLLSQEFIETYIDETLSYLEPAIARNEARWQSIYAADTKQYLDRMPENHATAVQHMKDWLKERGTWMDENIHVLRQYCHPSRNKNYLH